MFQDIKAFLKSLFDPPVTLEVDKRGRGIDEEVLISVLVLLIEMSSVDQRIDEEETQAVVAIIERHFGAPQELIISYVEKALRERERMGNLDPFIGMLNATYNDIQRCMLLALIWRITLADDSVEENERRLLVQLQSQLRLSEEQAAEARLRAESGSV